jgi:hypothetical protein
MPETPLIEIVRAAVGEVASAELPDVDRVARAYAKAPAAARRAGRANGNGPAVALLAVAVSADLCGQPLVTGPRTRPAEWWDRLRRRGRPDLDRAPPPVAEPDAARLEAVAVVTARERGASDEVATAIGAALARHWPRRS